MFTRRAKIRLLRVAGLAAGAVAVAGTAVVVTASAAGMSFGFKPSSGAAQAPAEATSASSTVCSDFMTHFAADLGKSQADVNSAFQKAIADTLADQVKSGQITQAQADAIKAKLAHQTPCTLGSVGKHGGKGVKGGWHAFYQEYVAASAAALGISETQLQSDLKGGQSLSQIAAARHVSEADFRTKLIANLKPALDKAVTDGKLTSDQEQKLIQRLQTGGLPLWDAETKQPQPSPSPSPATT
jgi:3-hydroxyacyl-CoA dehydrogenase